MKTKLLNPFRLCSVVLLLAIGVFGQQVSMDPFHVAPSDLIPKLVQLKKDRPDLKPDEFAKKANELMQISGFPFKFSFNDATCDAIARSLKESNRPAGKRKLMIRLQPLSGSATTLSIPPADFTADDCSKCSVTMPILEATDESFITIVMGQHIGFELPGGSVFSRLALVTDQTQQHVEREWRIPFRTMPIGISFDGRVIYLPFREPELEDIAIAVFSEGVFEIVPRSVAGAVGRSKETSAGFDHLEFDRMDKTYLVGSRPSCKN